MIWVLCNTTYNKRRKSMQEAAKLFRDNLNSFQPPDWRLTPYMQWDQMQVEKCYTDPDRGYVVAITQSAKKRLMWIWKPAETSGSLIPQGVVWVGSADQVGPLVPVCIALLLRSHRLACPELPHDTLYMGIRSLPTYGVEMTGKLHDAIALAPIPPWTEYQTYLKLINDSYLLEVS